MKLKLQLAAVFSLLIILSTGVLSYLFYRRISSLQFEQLRGTLISYASFAAISLDGDKHYKLSKYGSGQSPEFFEIRKKMRELMKPDSRIAEMYSLVKTDKKNTWKFIVDAAPDETEISAGGLSDETPAAKFGEEYDVSNYPEMQKAFEHPAADQKLTNDKWGDWLSGYAPIYNSSNEAVAVLGIDFSAHNVREELAKIRNIIFFISCICLFVGLGVANYFSYSLTKPIYELMRAAKMIGLGDYDCKVKVKTKNEIGFLAETMNSMAENIKRSFDKLLILNRTANILSSTLDLHHALKLSLNLVLEVTKSTKGVVFLLNRMGDNIDMAIGEGIRTMSAGPEILIDSAKIPKILKDGLPEQTKEIMKTLGCSHFFVLGVKDNVRGFLSFDTLIKDMDFLNILLKQVSFAIENAGLFHEAITDSLTGLYLRRYFQIQVETEIKRAKRYKKPLSLLMLDIDYFKRVNDEFGHPAGDFVLVQISQLIKKTIRDTDVASRYGGEEISILLPETPEDKALFIAERIRQEVEAQKFEYEGKIIKITSSIGVCSISGADELSLEQLIKRADLSLYSAKTGGRNKVCAWGG